MQLEQIQDTLVKAVEEDDISKQELLNALFSLTLSRRSPSIKRDIFVPRLGGLVMKLIQNRNNDIIVHMRCWQLFAEFLRMTDAERDNPEHFDLIDFVINIGILEEMRKEFELDDEKRIEIIETFLVPMTSLCLIPRIAPIINDSGVIKYLMKMASCRAPERVAVFSLICLTNLALHPVTHPVLLEYDALQTALGLLRFLTSNEDPEVDCALSAAFLICRVVGSDEVGLGADSIHENLNLIKRLMWILTRVLDVGPEGTVIGSHWNPANIVYDISILSSSDRNKPLLLDFIPLLTSGIVKYGESNQRLVRFTVQTFFQLHFIPEGREKILQERKEIVDILDKVMNNEIHADLTTFQYSSFLLQLIQETTALEEEQQ